jgi:hypothetical protein
MAPIRCPRSHLSRDVDDDFISISMHRTAGLPSEASDLTERSHHWNESSKLTLLIRWTDQNQTADRQGAVAAVPRMGI